MTIIQERQRQARLTAWAVVGVAGAAAALIVLSGCGKKDSEPRQECSQFHYEIASFSRMGGGGNQYQVCDKYRIACLAPLKLANGNDGELTCKLD